MAAELLLQVCKHMEIDTQIFFMRCVADRLFAVAESFFGFVCLQYVGKERVGRAKGRLFLDGELWAASDQKEWELKSTELLQRGEAPLEFIPFVFHGSRH